MMTPAQAVFRWLLIVCCLAGWLGCTKIYNGSDSASPTAPGRGANYKVEYRVSGTATGVTIRFSNSSDGLTQVSTSLPWSVTLTSNQDVLFVSIEVQPTSFSSIAPPFLSAQIYINGQLLREATATTFLTPLFVSATYRR